jgi:hypothetical protein
MDVRLAALSERITFLERRLDRLRAENTELRLAARAGTPAATYRMPRSAAS